MRLEGKQLAIQQRQYPMVYRLVNMTVLFLNNNTLLFCMPFFLRYFFYLDYLKVLGFKKNSPPMIDRPHLGQIRFVSKWFLGKYNKNYEEQASYLIKTVYLTVLINFGHKKIGPCNRWSI